MTGASDREPADHPGRPRGRDEVDPELLVLPRPRATIGPLLALSALVFCVYFLVRLKSDLVFAHAGGDSGPVKVESIAGALAADVDSWIELQAVPDRAALLRVYASDARDGHRLAPVLGSKGRLWLLLSGTHWADPPVYDETVRGRVKRLADLPFQGALAAELARTPLPRALEPGSALAVLGGAGELRDVAGDPVEVTPATPVTVVERAVGEARVTGVATDRQADEAAWRAALTGAGVLPAGAPLESKTDSTWTFRVPAPGGVEPIAAALVAARLFAARAEPVDRVHRAAWRDLRASSGDLQIAGAPESVRAASIAAILVEAVRRAPDDARVLVTTDRPDDYWYATPVCGALAVLALLFAWALWRGLRPPLGADTPPGLEPDIKPADGRAQETSP